MPCGMCQAMFAARYNRRFHPLHSIFPNKKDMILFIVDFSGDELGHGGMFNGTEAWIDTIDRGGL